MDQSRRVGMRAVLVATVLAGGVQVGSGVGLAGLVALSGFGDGMSGPPATAELVESVGAAMVVGVLGMLAAAVIAIIVARLFSRPRFQAQDIAWPPPLTLMDVEITESAVASEVGQRPAQTWDRLASRLFGEGLADAVSWVAFAVPAAICVWALWLRSSAQHLR